MESTLGVKYDLILALRIHIFENLLETFYRHVLEYLQSARSEKKWEKNVFFLRKRLVLAIIDLFEA